MTVGALPLTVIHRLLDNDVEVSSAAITATRGRVTRMRRELKIDIGQALDDVDIDRLPETLARAEQVLLDTEKRNLLFVFAPADPAASGKIVVEVNYADRVKLHGARRKERITTNAILSAGYVDPDNLRQARYQRVDGG